MNDLGLVTQKKKKNSQSIGQICHIVSFWLCPYLLRVRLSCFLEMPLCDPSFLQKSKAMYSSHMQTAESSGHDLELL